MTDKDRPRQVQDTVVQPGERPIDLDNPFWRFSLSVYSEEVVRRVCLDAQNRHGADVNLLLLCCWVGFSGVKLDAKALCRLDKLVDGWRQEVIQPMRALRNRLSEAIGPMGPQITKSLREDVMAAELNAEQIQQATLYQALETLPGRDARHAERSGVARLNLTVYLREVCGIGDASELREVVEGLVLGCREKLEREEEGDG